MVRSITKDRRVLAITDLRRTLVDLPVAAWPYGRVIAVQDCSIGIRDDALLRNIAAVLDIVKALGLDMERCRGFVFRDKSFPRPSAVATF